MDPIISIPEGTRFIEWKVVGIEEYICECDQYSGAHKRVGGLNLVAVYESVDAPETAFEKSKSEYQIVIKMDKSNCGEELKKLLQAEAQKQGATLSAIYDIKAEERAKKDYTYTRDIMNVANEITYMISLPADLTKAAGEGKNVSLLHYKEDGTVELLQDLDLEKGTITVKTKKPSGVFAFIIK